MLIKYNNHLLRLKHIDNFNFCSSEIFLAKYYYICFYYDNMKKHLDILDIRQFFYYNNDLYFIYFILNINEMNKNINNKNFEIIIPKIHIAGIACNIKLNKDRYIKFIKSYLNIIKYY